MTETQECPEIAQLPALLGDDAAFEKWWQRFEGHLDTCAACQGRLDCLDLDPGDVLRLARQVGDPSMVPADPTLIQVLKQMHQMRLPLSADMDGPANLQFLSPADRAGLLGKLGAYEVQEVIGQGGMGIVLKAFEPALHRHVAIKVLSPALAGSATARLRFTREAKAAAAVSHDHVVVVHGVHEKDGLPYLVMEYIAGESLQQRIDRSGPLELTEIVRIGLQTASGLAAAHAQGLIHRDIKPANLLLENGLERVTITDFGLARSVDDVQLTQNGTVAGTPEYMAPEQARDAAIDHRADLFSLGSVLYAMATGVPPFRGSTALAVLRHVDDQTPLSVRTLNPAIPAWLETLITRLMAKDPNDRIQSAAEVAALLERYLAHLRHPATTPVPELAVLRTVARRGASDRPGLGFVLRRAIVPMVVVFLAGMGLGLWVIRTGQPSGDAMRAQPGDDVVKPPELKEPELRDQLVRDFRGRPVPIDLTPFGPLIDPMVRAEPEGLRFTLPRDRAGTGSVGLSMAVTVGGDFEITTAFEVLRADEPAPLSGSYGVGVLMSINEKARVGRLLRAGNRHVLTWDRWATVDGEPRFFCGAAPSVGNVVRLRLARRKNVLHFLGSTERAGDQFQEAYQCDFDAPEVTLLRLELASDVGNGQNGALDVRLLELRIRSSTAPVAPAVAPDEKAAAAPLNTWFIGAAALGLVVPLALVAGVVARRHRHPAMSEKSAANATTPGKVMAEAASIAFACSGCGKRLKARAALIGKKVMCPRCGQSVLVTAVAT
jgi:hypothetical protein